MNDLTAAGLFDELALEFLSEPGIFKAKMFGGIALKLNNRVFACLFKGQLVLKLSKERVDQLVAAHEGENFDPGMGRVMREWVAVDPGTPDEWQALMQEARSFVGALYA